MPPTSDLREGFRGVCRVELSKIATYRIQYICFYFIILECGSEENDFLASPGTCLLHFVPPKQLLVFKTCLFSPCRTISSKKVTKGEIWLGEMNNQRGWWMAEPETVQLPPKARGKSEGVLWTLVVSPKRFKMMKYKQTYWNLEVAIFDKIVLQSPRSRSYVGGMHS